jgi:hypothetical protein
MVSGQLYMTAGLTPKGKIPPNVSHRHVRGSDEENIFYRQESNPDSSVSRSHSLVATPSIYLPFILSFSQSVGHKPLHNTNCPLSQCCPLCRSAHPTSVQLRLCPAALSAVTINRTDRRDVSLEQHAGKPQPPLCALKQQSFQGTA